MEEESLCLWRLQIGELDGLEAEESLVKVPNLRVRDLSYAG